jgi:5-(carboxyamino)imidazole ribonucleotide synthase
MSIQKKVGILGGGQLGRMLLQEAPNLDIYVAVLDPDKDAPAKYLCHHFVQGSFSDFDTVYQFGQLVDLITIEIEHVNINALKKLQSEGKEVYPQPEIIELIQDKGLQKQFYQNNSILTSPFVLLNDTTDLITVSPDFFPAYQKSRKAGYDGKGVKRIEHNSIDAKEALSGPTVLEKAVNHQVEIAVITASNGEGQVISFPVIEMEFNAEANLVERVWMPSELPDSIQQKAHKVAKELTLKLGIRGLLAVEMFVTHEGEILVNEIAPRPHNSGHQTIEGCTISQFAMHWRAILGLPLITPQTTSVSCMVNVLGEKGFSGPVKYLGMHEVLEMSKVYPHLYGKKITKPFRKMGHVTLCGDSRNELKIKSSKVMQVLRVISN